MIALMYEITCRSDKSPGAVISWMASLMKEDRGVTKMFLALIQAAIAVRSAGFYAVRNLERVDVREALQRI